ncbi:MAG: hypothetical protein HQL74_04345 [Magnetococcales bacterium]|nr:hypothetical protein [Magnetococcales bacterium]
MNNDVKSLLDNAQSVDKLMQTLQQDTTVQSMVSGFSVEGIVASIVFSIIGMAYMRTGKKNGPLSTMLYGLVLLIFPYFVTDFSSIMLIGCLFTVLPFLFKFG